MTHFRQKIFRTEKKFILRIKLESFRKKPFFQKMGEFLNNKLSLFNVFKLVWNYLDFVGLFLLKFEFRRLKYLKRFIEKYGFFEGRKKKINFLVKVRKSLSFFKCSLVSFWHSLFCLGFDFFFFNKNLPFHERGLRNIIWENFIFLTDYSFL